VTGLAEAKPGGATRGGVVVALAAGCGLPVHMAGVDETAAELQPGLVRAPLARTVPGVRQARHVGLPVPPLGRAGLWARLLQAFADADRPGSTVLRQLGSWICRTHRRV